MIRKQFYIAEKQQRKLRSLAAKWQCTEAEVVRTALDRLSEPEDTVEEALRRAGMLAEPRDDEDLPPASEIPVLEAKLHAWARSRRKPLDLARTVLEDRR